eukprot:11156554-Lingulodinium_polyedra.AAC.1
MECVARSVGARQKSNRVLKADTVVPEDTPFTWGPVLENALQQLAYLLRRPKWEQCSTRNIVLA